MGLKILGVITEEKVEKVKVEKHIDELSNRLYESNIPHLIIEDDSDGICIMPTQCAPSILKYNMIDKQWEYIERYMEDGAENSTILTNYVIKDSNKKFNILDFVKMVLKLYNGETHGN